MITYLIKILMPSLQANIIAITRILSASNVAQILTQIPKSVARKLFSVLLGEL